MTYTGINMNKYIYKVTSRNNAFVIVKILVTFWQDHIYIYVADIVMFVLLLSVQDTYQNLNLNIKNLTSNVSVI